MIEQEEKIEETRLKFIEKYSELSEVEIQKEQLFIQQLSFEKLEKIRSNTSTLVWLIAIPFIISLLYLLFSSLEN